VHFPDESVKVVNIRSDSVFETPSKSFNYSFPLEIKKAGWYSFILTTKYDLNRAVEPEFYKHLSNKRSILLRPVPK